MAAVSSGRSVMDPQGDTENGITIDERLKQLYPNVDEEKTPLPRCWSTKDKYTYIGLSQNNLRVHYKVVVSSQTEEQPRSQSIYECLVDLNEILLGCR
ncbi:ran binding protein 9-related [Holotrichia oblita]|uniref:Ran binding protein 9-related n=1 Tax=Holotrichia oblita TaxID=644536 RepID=A0ACB9TIQ0_HOLOL|nr:ran binding protein 9-related [Holotrichia oblita]